MCCYFIKKGEQQVCRGVQDLPAPIRDFLFDVIRSTEKNQIEGNFLIKVFSISFCHISQGFSLATRERRPCLVIEPHPGAHFSHGNIGW